jgi:hypothetical protein
MGRTRELIAAALQVIARKSRSPGLLGETVSRASRRRFLTGVISSVAAVAVVIAVAVVLVPADAFGGGPAPASIPLHWPLELRQIASVTAAAQCPPGSVASPPSGGGLCFNLTRTGMTVTAVQSAYIHKQSLHVPKGAPPVPDAVFWVTLRLTPSGGAQILALTRNIYRQSKPHEELADIMHGRLIEFSIVHGPDTEGAFSLAFSSRAAAESLLSQLLHG